jgi:hypothetical protein
MGQGIKTIMFPVKDPAGAKALFQALLGVEPYADQSNYVGFRVDGQEIGLDPKGHAKGLTGPVGYWHVEDVPAALQRLWTPARRRNRGSRISAGAGCRPSRET